MTNPRQAAWRFSGRNGCMNMEHQHPRIPCHRSSILRTSKYRTPTKRANMNEGRRSLSQMARRICRIARKGQRSEGVASIVPSQIPQLTALRPRKNSMADTRASHELLAKHAVRLRQPLYPTAHHQPPAAPVFPAKRGRRDIIVSMKSSCSKWVLTAG